MATFTYELNTHRKRKDGTVAVALRITHKRQFRRIALGYVSEHDLTRGGKIRNHAIIDKFEETLLECRRWCTELGIDVERMDVEEVANYIKRRMTDRGGFKLDFLKYIEDQAQKMHGGTQMAYLTALRAVRKYTGRQSLDISEVTYPFLKGLEASILGEDGTKVRAAIVYMTCLKAMHNRAKNEYNDEDSGYIPIPLSPFSKYKILPAPITKKRALDMATIQQIINLHSNYSAVQKARDCFLLSFALLGINSADLYSCPPPKDGVLIYNRQKTASRRADRAEMRVKIPECVKPLVEKYRDPEGVRAFSFYHRYSDTRLFNFSLNRGLKYVGKTIGVEGLQYYSARHSMATIARSSAVGIEKATVHEMLNHVDNNMKITDIYIERDWSVLWTANEKLLAMFDWSKV